MCVTCYGVENYMRLKVARSMCRNGMFVCRPRACENFRLDDNLKLSSNYFL